MRHKDENSPDRPVLEVTPQMVEAGIDAMVYADPDSCSPVVLVSAVYRAMAGLARPLQQPVGSQPQR
jgi:hypothetical protein